MENWKKKYFEAEGRNADLELRLKKKFEKFSSAQLKPKKLPEKITIKTTDILKCLDTLYGLYRSNEEISLGATPKDKDRGIGVGIRASAHKGSLTVFLDMLGPYFPGDVPIFQSLRPLGRE